MVGRSYWLDYTVEFASDAQTGCVGVGGRPGESVWIKVGGAEVEPRNVSLLEVFDASSAPDGEARMVNVSTHARVGVGERALISGLVVDGPQPEKVLIRAVGPGLSTFGVTDFLPDPKLQLFDCTKNLAENDSWDRTADGALSAAAGEKAGAFPLQPASRAAALLITLASGVYTARVQCHVAQWASR